MKKELNQKEKVERLAKWMSRAEFYTFLVACVIGILSFCKRLQLVFGVDSDALFITVGLLLMLILVVIEHLHAKILPEDIAGYPVYASVFGNVVVSEDSAKDFTKVRMIGGGIVIGVTLVLTIFANIFWSSKTIPDEVTLHVLITEDETIVRSDDFGVVATWTEEDGVWSGCTSIDAYGPFEYGGDVKEMSILHVITDDVVWGETEEKYASHVGHEILDVKFNHYEDGDWMIVKHVKDTEVPMVIDYVDGRGIILSSIREDKMSYTKHDFTETAQEKIRTLTAATNDVLEWEEVDDKLVWSVKE